MRRALSKRDIEDIFTLSPLQEGLLFHTLKDPKSSFYTDQNSYRLKGTVNVRHIKIAFNELVRRHSMLRTVFNYKKLAKPVQVVLKFREMTFCEEDISHFPTHEEKERFIEAFRKKDFKKGFDLSSELLMRVSIIKLAVNEYEMIWTHHHILMDGWCTGLLLKEFNIVYNSSVANKSYNLPPIVPFKNYIKWLENFNRKKATEFWTNHLKGLTQRTNVPYFSKMEVERPTVTNSLEYLIDAKMTSALIAMSKKTRTTLNTIIISAWGILLSKYNNTRDAVFGSVVSGRPSELRGVQEMVGLFINTIPMRITYREQTTFYRLIENTQTAFFDSLPYHYLPLPDIQLLCELKRELFNHILVFENLPDFQDTDNKVIDKEGVIYAKHSDRNHHTNYPLVINIFPDSEIKMMFEYNQNVISKRHIQKMIDHFGTLLSRIVSSPDQCIDTIKILTEKEQLKITQAGKGKRISGCELISVVDMFKKRAKQSRDRCALISQNIWSFFELNTAANKVANYLIKHFPDETVIGVMLNPSEWYVISLFGILKSGKAFLPIDIENPIKRKAFIMNDVGLKVLVTEIDQILSLSDVYHGTVLSIEKQLSDFTDDIEPEMIISGNSPAYIIYTSGSTGHPKGVLVNHEAFSNYISWANDYYFQEDHTYHFGAFTSIAFDLSLTGVFTSLTKGNVLHLFEQGSIDSTLKIVFATNPSIDFVKLTPSIASLIGQLNLQSVHVKGVIAGGEHLKNEHLRILKTAFPNAIIYNEYGPTEATIGCSVEKIEYPEGKVTIGGPIQNIQIFVLDDTQALCPEGVVGEIYIGGKSLATGYLNSPALTSSHFFRIRHLGDQILYRTGDLGMWTSDYKLTIVGREDYQYKIHGYRIELSEIERAVLEYKAIIDVRIVYQSVNEDYILSAYYLSAEEIREENLLTFLKDYLPHYMLPSVFRRLEKFPMTSNGKIDMDQLSGMAQLQYTEIELPKTEKEERLLRLWQDVFNKEKISVTDNFFSLGGHSLLAIRIIAKIYKEFGVELELSLLFEKPTIRQLATSIHETSLTFESIMPIEEQDYYNVTHNQKRLWILTQIANTGSAYQITESFELNGAIDKMKLQNAFQELIEKYEILRTNFVVVNLEPKQKIRSHHDFDFEVLFHDLSSFENPFDQLKKVAKAINQTKFDVTYSLLIKASLIKVSDTKFILFITMHHLVYDEWSLEILRDNLLRFFNGKSKNELLKIQFKDCSAWINKQLQTLHFNTSKDYWNNRFREKPQVLNLPIDFKRPKKKTYSGVSIGHFIDHDLSLKITSVAQSLSSSEFILLTAALKALLYHYTRQNDITIGTPATGRYHSDLETQIGFFVNTLALRTNIQAKNRFRQLLYQTRLTILEAYNHQIYPFDFLVDNLHEIRDQSRSPIFDVMVIFQNAKMMRSTSETFEGMTVGHYEFDDTSSQFDLTFIVQRFSDKFGISINYNSDLFTMQTVRKMLNNYIQLLKSVLDNLDICIDDLEFISLDEKQQLLHMSNGRRSECDRFQTIPMLVDKNLHHSLDSVAISFEDKFLTCGELSLKANSVAHHLIEKFEIQKGDRVGLLMGNSDSLIITILAILKCGGIYVPVDPKFPEQRIRHIFDDANVKLIIHDKNVFLLEWNHVSAGDLLTKSKPFFEHINESSYDDIAYILYTSGSTGTPKGVAISHQNSVSFLQSIHLEFSRLNDTVILATTSYTFDLSIFEIFFPLTKGLRVHILASPLEIPICLLREHNLLINTVPSVIESLVVAGSDLRNVTAINMAGEPIFPSILDRLNLNKITVRNLYGPTETTTYSTCFNFKDNSEKILIGSPLSNTEIYILNDSGKLVPGGVVGEIFIGGEGVTMGYINKPELTCERFLANHITGKGFLYQTGDIGRWTASGQIELKGREDHQVKIRGHRIELGEIEQVVNSYPFIIRSIARIWKDMSGEKIIVIYFTAKKSLQTEIIQQHVKEFLPEIMRPRQYIQLDKFKTNDRGKIDYNALPVPVLRKSKNISPGSSSMSSTEKLIHQLWLQVLDIKELSVNDNFFELGGNSLKIIQLYSLYLDSFSNRIKISDLFDYPTITGQAQLMKKRSIPENLDILEF